MIRTKRKWPSMHLIVISLQTRMMKNMSTLRWPPSSGRHVNSRDYWGIDKSVKPIKRKSKKLNAGETSQIFKGRKKTPDLVRMRPIRSKRLPTTSCRSTITRASSSKMTISLKSRRNFSRGTTICPQERTRWINQYFPPCCKNVEEPLAARVTPSGPI